MNTEMRIAAFIVILLLVADISTQAQGTFQNLAFESATLTVSGDPLQVPFTNAFPSWTGQLGPYQATEATYNGIAGGFAAISIIGRNSGSYSNYVIAGNYTAAISAGFAGTGFVSTAIAETGMTPATAQSIRFAAQLFRSIQNIESLEVTFAGQLIPIVQLGSGSNFQIYGGDISSFAGMTGELRFTQKPTFASVTTTVLLDNIQFSTSPIPEPGTFSLIALGGLFLCLRLRQFSRPA